MPTIGSLCSGYGGLDLGVQAVIGGTVVWHAENDRHASQVLAHRWPGVPNLGDITAVDWSTAEAVDVMTAGYPCQPFSGAGPRRGESDERNIWPHIAKAVRVLRPRLVVLENVAAHLAMGFGRVQRDLAALRYDTRWTCLRAADVGAPHGRDRLFVAAIADSAASRHQPRPTPHPQQPAAGSANSGVPAVAAEWGRYAPALSRWVSIAGRPVPGPVELGRTGNLRVTTKFTEWLMGLGDGHVSGSGIPYTAQHRVLGNGVVPQQAAAALRWLLEGDPVDVAG